MNFVVLFIMTMRRTSFISVKLFSVIVMFHIFRMPSNWDDSASFQMKRAIWQDDKLRITGCVWSESCATEFRDWNMSLFCRSWPSTRLWQSWRFLSDIWFFVSSHWLWKQLNGYNLPKKEKKIIPSLSFLRQVRRIEISLRSSVRNRKVLLTYGHG